jgi:hypothetical protein
MFLETAPDKGPDIAKAEWIAALNGTTYAAVSRIYYGT